MRHVVYDVETLKNAFTCVTYDINSKDKRKFVIHESRNDFEEFLEYINSCDKMIGFNNIGFDYRVLHDYLFDSEFKAMDGDTLARALYSTAQATIEESNGDKQPKWITPFITQLDLYRIWHFNNKARSTSLKWLQFCMQWPNVQEMPLHHSVEVLEKDIPMILEYNENDVMSTHRFWELSQDKIKLRDDLTEKYGINMSNYPDTKIGERIFIRGISEISRRKEADLMKGRTPRKEIVIKNCLISNLHFVSKEFQQILNLYKDMVITETKQKENYSCLFDGVKYDFGFGGLHALREPGVYQNLRSADVKSYYPNLSIGNKFFPQHLGLDFVEVYRKLYLERASYPKGSAESEALKLALNGTFGASNAYWSPFYDPAFTMRITLNGQFILAILCERLTLLHAARVIMANTDGLEVEVLDEKKFKDVCDLWQKEFTLTLEFDSYETIAIANVNNYIGRYKSGKVKEKGAFETDKLLYKDQSMKIVPIAVRKYFLEGVPVANTIEDCQDIGKFVLGHRAKTGGLRYRDVDGQRLIDDVLPKTMRYYVSQTGGAIVKVVKTKVKSDYVISERQTSLFDVGTESVTTKEKIIKLHVGRRMTMFNRWQDKPFQEYGVDKSFYINEALKMIDSVVKTQSSI